jgi:hypothetical protein
MRPNWTLPRVQRPQGPEIDVLAVVDAPAVGVHVCVT